MKTRYLVLAATAVLLSPGLVRGQLAPVGEQIKGAVLPLPENQRAGATVMGYRVEGQLTVIKQGTGDMICLADAPGNETYHVACYHESLEPLMKMGRELSAQGIVDPERNQRRAAAAEAGTLKMPDVPAAFHSLTGPETNWSPEAGTFEGAAAIHTVYIPWATGETTGLSTQPASAGAPWLMFPGTYRAHIMIIPDNPPPGGE